MRKDSDHNGKPHQPSHTGRRRQRPQGPHGRSGIDRRGGLEIKGKLKLGNSRNHVFPVLSGSDQKKSGSLVASENIRAQITASHLAVCGGLKSGPVLGLDESLVTQPLGNRLLLQRRAVHRARKPRGKRRLAPGNLDGATKGSNVRFIHEHPLYTTRVVRVNDLGCVHYTGPMATVSCMPATKRKEQFGRPKRVREAAKGPDGLTFGDRLRACMLNRARALGRAPDDYTQNDLIEEATRAVGAILR